MTRGTERAQNTLDYYSGGQLSAALTDLAEWAFDAGVDFTAVAAFAAARAAGRRDKNALAYRRALADSNMKEF